MRDPKRIKPFIETIEKLWAENPDFRFGQLIMAITKTGVHNPVLFNMEEDVFIERIAEFKNQRKDK
jgi:uncharacterized protein YihD (DUF1040 family)